MDNNINVCTLITGSLWTTGVSGFILISLGLMGPQHGGIALVLFTSGSMLYLRKMIRCQRTREDVAFELGRLTNTPGRAGVRSVP